tara:strand:- start:46 stop:420 length:375 start_codon:yes stop_codon:yes gene_type:complete
MRDLSKPLAETFPTRKKRTKRRTTVKTPTYELGSNKRLAMNKNTVTTDKKGNVKKSRGVSKSGGKKTVSKTNYKTGKEVNRTRKTVGSVVRGAARKAGVGQKKGQRSLATAPTTRGELGYKVRK